MLVRLFPTSTWERWRMTTEALPSSFFRSDDNMRLFLTSKLTERQLGIENPADWYRVSAANLIEMCSPASRPAIAVEISRRAQVLCAGPRSESWLAALLRMAFPEKAGDWFLDWKFIHAQPTAEFWRDHGNVRKFFFDLQGVPLSSDGSSLPFQENLQSLTRSQVRAAPGGGGLLQCFESSVIKAIQAGFPAATHPPWRFNKVPNGFWDAQGNQRAFFEWAEKELRFHRKEDWYSATVPSLVELGAHSLLLRHKKSLPNALKHAFPEHEWLEWKFLNVSKGFWDSLPNQRRFFDHVIGAPNNPLDHWYTVSADAVVQQGGSRLLKSYGHSLRRALEAVYADHHWHAWLFQPQNHNIWDDATIRMEYFSWLGRQVGIARLEDWYSTLSVELLQQYRGGTLLARNGQSPVLAVLSAFPEHTWHEWRFRTVPVEFWMSRANRVRYFSWLQTEMGIDKTSMERWYSVTNADVAARHGASVLAEYYGGSVPNALRQIFPEHLWEDWRFVQRSAVS